MSDLPKSLLRTLNFVNSLTEEEFEKIAESIMSVNYFESRRVVEEAVVAASKPEHHADADDLATFLMVFARHVHDDEGATLSSTFASMTEADNLNLSSAERSSVLSRINTLINSPALVVASRSSHAENNHDRNILAIGIDTDIRPLLGKAGELESIIPFHSMTLTYDSRDDDKRRTMDFVLDHFDLVEMKRLIEGALTAQVAVQTQMAKQGIGVWEPYTEVDEAKGDAE